MKPRTNVLVIAESRAVASRFLGFIKYTEDRKNFKFIYPDDIKESYGIYFDTFITIGPWGADVIDKYNDLVKVANSRLDPNND